MTKKSSTQSPRRAAAAFQTASTAPARDPARELRTFPNPTPARDFLIHMDIPEFTCLCPLTGQPDFANLVLDYIPDRTCVELKSMKLYIWSYRNEGAFHEAVTNKILDDVVAAIEPRYARLVARFFVRGGIFTTVVAEHRRRGWKSTIDVPAVVMTRAAPAV
ncbi:MAG: preQ(1) synthase [Burkholderiales bacterium]